MNVVIDTSIIIAVIFAESQRDALIEITKGTELIAPASVHWEVGNAISSMLKRNRTGLEQALRGIDIYRQIPIRFVEVELDETVAIAAQLGVYAYDAYLIRCALRWNAPLLALDQGLLRAARQMGVETMEVA